MDFDLEPHHWKSSDKRAKPREPFFGPGLPDAIGYLIGFSITVTVVYFVLH